MAIIQTNVWICEKCGAMHSESELEAAWTDPLITPPIGWYAEARGEELCPPCAKEERREPVRK